MNNNDDDGCHGISSHQLWCGPSEVRCTSALCCTILASLARRNANLLLCAATEFPAAMTAAAGGNGFGPHPPSGDASVMVMLTLADCGFRFRSAATGLLPPPPPSSESGGSALQGLPASGDGSLMVMCTGPPPPSALFVPNVIKVQTYYNVLLGTYR